MTSASAGEVGSSPDASVRRSSSAASAAVLKAARSFFSADLTDHDARIRPPWARNDRSK